jgi:hypothetical protein
LKTKNTSVITLRINTKNTSVNYSQYEHRTLQSITLRMNTKNTSVNCSQDEHKEHFSNYSQDEHKEHFSTLLSGSTKNS